MHTQRGFTLVELMIALLLGAIVAVTLTGITRSMVEESKNQQYIVEASETARAGMDMLRMDLMRTGMFVAANPRNAENPDSLVSNSGVSGTHAAYYRNAIVHLNPGGTGPDSVVLVGNFIGDRVYEAEVDVEAGNQIRILGGITEDHCLREFNPKYAFAHIITGTGQTHEAKLDQGNPPDAQNCVGGFCECLLTFPQGELIDGAFGERLVKVAANQAVMYRVEVVQGRGVLMRYFIDYDGNAPMASNCNVPTSVANFIHFPSAVEIAENVVDFQIWFRPIDPASIGGNVDRALYHPLATLSTNAAPLRPLPTNVIVGANQPDQATTLVHLSCPTGAGGNVLGPEHIRSAIVSLSVRMNETDQSVRLGQDTDSDTDAEGASMVVERELAPPPAGDVGMYRTRRYYMEVKLPNLMSQMASFQFGGNTLVF